MIEKIKVINYKCLDSVELTFGKLNIITGSNSAGKSSLIQSILDYCNVVECHPSLPESFRFSEVRNMHNNAREMEITINENALIATEDEMKFSNGKPPENFPIKNKGLYYLSATRIGPKELHSYKKGKNNITGDDGEFIFSVFENKSNEPIAEELIKCENDFTLAGNVNFWLKEILISNTQLKSEIVSNNTIKINYKFENLPRTVSPQHLGSGVSYLVQVIILCLLAKPGEIVIIENPEIHLRPAVQSKLGEFFAFIASKGIQLIIETHCEHLINRVRYEVGYEKAIEDEQVKIFYKSGNREPFIKIGLNSSGHYTDESGKEMAFPPGFFDATLDILLELY